MYQDEARSDRESLKVFGVQGAGFRCEGTQYRVQMYQDAARSDREARKVPQMVWWWLVVRIKVPIGFRVPIDFRVQGSWFRVQVSFLIPHPLP